MLLFHPNLIFNSHYINYDKFYLYINMGKNVGIGGKKRKMGKKNVQVDRELALKTEMQEYAQIIRLLGDARFEVQCMDTVKRIAHIRGKMIKRVWVAAGDVVLVSLREYEPEKCDIIVKYNEEEARKLKTMKEIPESIKVNEENKQNPEDNGDVEFFGQGDDDEEDFKPKKKKGWEASSDEEDISEEEKELNIDNI
jgi:translation initiation factor 1A